MASVTTADLARFFEQLGVLKVQSLESASEQAPAFNIFRLLGIHRKEDETHSVILADLLNPLGRHGQGVLFLKAFLECCSNKYQNDILSFPKLTGGFVKTGWYVQREVMAGSGRLDIVIGNPTQGYRLVIENKIGAAERFDQIHKYHQWLTKSKQFYPYCALIFLTPTGRTADSGEKNTYFPMSYHHDIAAWLTDTLPKIKAEHVYFTVKQYITLVSSI